MKIVKTTKDIMGVTVFKSEQDAERARRNALIAEAKWKKAFTISIAGMIIFWVCYFIAFLTDANVLALVGMVVSIGTYIFCEAYYGKFKWTKAISSFLSGASGMFVVLWFFELLFLFMIVIILVCMAVFYGLGILFLMGDRYYLRMTVESTNGYGFDDSRAMKTAADIASKDRADAEKWKKTAASAASKAKDVAKSGADTINKKVSIMSEGSVDSAVSSTTDYYRSESELGNEDAAPVSSQGTQKIWYCPQCGSRNDGNFCSACGTAKP